MERAFVNVLENARRHSGGHPGVGAARARGAGARRTAAATGASGDRVIVRIVDRGPGIPPAQLERVFEPFYRAGTPGGEHRGSGLGLAIARGFTEANGGTLHVESLPGQGATFVFELPLEPVGAERADDGRRRRPASGRRAERRRARRVSADAEPDAEPRRAARARRRRRAADRARAESGAARGGLRGGRRAKRRARRSTSPRCARREAAIVDLVLPDGDGIEVTRRLREWSEMPILVLSAVGEEEQKVRALEAGADDYITKPFGTRELVARLQAALRRAGRAEEEPTIAVGGPGDRPRRAVGAPRRRARPPDADRVRPAARAGAQPRAADDPPHAARARCGGRSTSTTSSRCAPTSRGCARRSSRRARRRRATSSPTPASATASPAEVPSAVEPLPIGYRRCATRHEIVMRAGGSSRGRDGRSR